MSADVMDGDQRHAEREARGLGKADAGEQSADQAGRGRHRDRVDVAAAEAGFGQRMLDGLRDGLDVPPRGELRHDSAVFGVHLNLGIDRLGENGAAVFGQRRGRFVAGGFDGEDFHRSYDALARQRLPFVGIGAGFRAAGFASGVGISDAAAIFAPFRPESSPAAGR